LRKSAQAVENKGQELQKEAQESSRVRKRLKEWDVPARGTEKEGRKNLRLKGCAGTECECWNLGRRAGEAFCANVVTKDSKWRTREQLVRWTVEV
jgi:hypothetical protein